MVKATYAVSSEGQGKRERFCLPENVGGVVRYGRGQKVKKGSIMHREGGMVDCALFSYPMASI